MNHTIKIAAVAALIAISIVAFAADVNYPQLRKDVSVMEKILLTEFERGDGVRIRGNYLANQGAIFTITAPQMMQLFDIERGDETSSFMIHRGDGEEMEFSFVGDINAMVSDALGAVNFGPGFDTELRQMARELARESRELEREVARLRIERVHVDDEKKTTIDEELEDVQTEMEQIIEKRESMQRELETKAKEMEEKHRALREEREAERQKRIAAIESKLLRSLCDYGSTLSNLPNNEHVSIVIDGVAKNKQKIYVFDRGQVTSCRSGSNELTRNALQYMF